MDIQIDHLVKDYGRVRALDNVNLHIGSGMFGLLGPNGAGKTTLMRILTTLLPPTSGTIRVGVLDVTRQPAQVRRQLGYIPQDFGFFKSLNAFETLDYIATMKNLPQPQRRQQVGSLLEQVNLTGDARRRVGGYSGGMKQRLGIAQALLGNPALLVVDEPTAGLDPEERIRFRNLLARLSGERTVLLSTHIVADIEAACTRLAVLNKGRLAFLGTPQELTARAQGRVWHLDIAPAEWDTVETRYRVVASRPVDGRLLTRIVAEDNPLGRSAAAEPGLEDGYIAVMAGYQPEGERIHA